MIESVDLDSLASAAAGSGLSSTIAVMASKAFINNVIRDNAKIRVEIDELKAEKKRDDHDRHELEIELRTAITKLQMRHELNDSRRSK